ncbi:uncharacterized protein N7487_012035 [Penicillium crustosum]|uniref:uncharacterized protein n=1 Tax=Penicillium crustosum TaxID=36656 RepID=UPI0023A347DE|nr:uncharacterized protein N7487_012035 [Penicillium crustosum]KAJ5394394.1 hypothetical protein N7487_012035 [Penicillium crustosum]
MELYHPQTDLILTYGNDTVVLSTLVNIMAFHLKSRLEAHQIVDRPDSRCLGRLGSQDVDSIHKVGRHSTTMTAGCP